MLPKGYCLLVRNNKAEIVEFNTKSTDTMPDGSMIYCVTTKYGEDFFHENDLSPIKGALEKDCNELNKVLRETEGEKKRDIRSIYKPRPQRG